eukprot:1500904-Pleurochrysis_carterae.AAC.1
MAGAGEDALPVCAWIIDMSRARTSASISGLDRVMVRQFSAALGVAFVLLVADGPALGALTRLAVEGLTRV